MFRPQLERLPDPPMFNAPSAPAKVYARALIPENCIGSVPRIDCPSRDVFRRNFLNPNLPVIVSGMVDRWPAYQRWSVQYLDARLNSDDISVYSTENANYSLLPRRGIMARIATGGSDGNPAYYLANANIRDTPSRPAARNHGNGSSLPSYFSVSELNDDVVLPEILDPESFRQVNYWAASDGITTNLHWDELHNILALLSGRKEGILFPPSESRWLYPVTLFDRPMNEIRSHIDLSRDDIGDVFPRYKRAKYYRFDLQRGEALFIPATYWHYVRSHEFTMSLTFGFAGPRSPAALQRLTAANCVAVVHTAVSPAVKRWQTRLPATLRRGWFADASPPPSTRSLP